MDELAKKFETFEKKLSNIEDTLLLGQKEMLVVDDVAKLTGLKRDYIYQLTSKRAIPFYKPTNKLLYFKKSELLDWMQQNRVSTNDELEARAAAYNLKRSMKMK